MATGSDAVDCPIITIDGPYFYRKQERFIARGLVFQTHVDRRTLLAHRPIWDPLDDRVYSRLLVDVAVFKEMNINALWVNTVDPSVTRSQSMRLLAKLGIYVIFKIDCLPVVNSGADTRKVYSAELLREMTTAIDAVAGYPNTLGVCIASKAISPENVRRNDWLHLYGSLTQELKRYMRYRNHDTGQRILPLCIDEEQWSAQSSSTLNYVANMDVPNRPAGGRVDFYTLVHHDTRRHAYDPMGGTMFPNLNAVPPAVPPVVPTWTEQLPMEELAAPTHPIPIMISEYANMALEPGEFPEVGQLYGHGLDSPLLDTLSGGFVFEYYNSSRGCGLVSFGLDGKLKMRRDFWNFRSAMRDALGLPTRHEIETMGLPSELQIAFAPAS